MKPLAFSFLLITCGIAQQATAPSLTVGTRIYTDATVTLENPQTALIRHDSGTARVPAADLPPALQNQLGYDPAAAQQHRQATAEKTATVTNQRAEAAAFQNSHLQKFEISLNTPEGLIVYNYKRTVSHQPLPTTLSRAGGGGKARTIEEINYTPLFTRSFIAHTAETRALPVGQIFFAKAIETGTKRLDETDLVTVKKIQAIRLPK